MQYTVLSFTVYITNQQWRRDPIGHLARIVQKKIGENWWPTGLDNYFNIRNTVKQINEPVDGKLDLVTVAERAWIEYLDYKKRIEYLKRCAAGETTTARQQQRSA